MGSDEARYEPHEWIDNPAWSATRARARRRRKAELERRASRSRPRYVRDARSRAPR